MIQHLSHERDFANIFLNYDNFKRKIRIVFEIINEIFISKRVVQYLTQKTFTINYAQCFKIYFDKTNWNNNFKINIFKKRFKTNVKKELVRKNETYNKFNEFIIIIIKINDV